MDLIVMDIDKLTASLEIDGYLGTSDCELIIFNISKQRSALASYACVCIYIYNMCVCASPLFLKRALSPKLCKIMSKMMGRKN